MARCCAFTLLAVAVAGLTADFTPAQPPNKAVKWKQFDPAKGVPVQPGGRIIIIPSVVDEEQIPDWRLVLAGLVPKNKPPTLDPKLMKELMDNLPKDQKADEKQIQDILKNHPELKNPAFLQQLGQMKQDPSFPENFNQKLPEGIPAVPKDGPAKENLEQLIEQGMKPAQVSEGGPKGEPITPPKGDLPKMDPSTSDPGANSNAGDNPWVKWMQKNFGDSPAGQQAIKDLMGALEKQDMKGMFDQVPEFKNGGWKDIDSWGKSNAGELWNMKPPDFGGTKFNPPNMGGGSSGPSPSLGSGSESSSLGGSGAGFGGGGSALAVIAAIAGAALLAVLLFRKWKVRQAERAAAAAGGRAGIDFDSIRTREALVKAFDHVSLDQIGAEARPWNHRVIAEQIGTTRPAQAEPADELAGLYERARYAPDDEDLSAGEFTSARHDLRVIAGVPA